jgi:ABC-type lipopolysaccharide export system ATPase subunit
MLNRTIVDLRRRVRKQDQIAIKAAATIRAMLHGQSLHLHHDRQQTVWWLSGGERIDADVAALVISNPSIVSVGDALPLGIGAPAQTWRYVEE